MWAKLKEWDARRKQRAVLRAHVEALGEARFDGFRCVVQAGLSRVFLSRDGEAFDIRVPADFVIDPRAVQPTRLKEAGFALESGVSGLEWRRRTKQLVDDVETVLADGFGVSQSFVYSVAVEPDRSASSPELGRAMRRLAKLRSMDARHALYRALVGATLLLAVEHDALDGTIHPLEDEEDLGGRATWLAFSAPEKVQEHSLQPQHVSLSGLRLVQAALHRRIGSLRLDFGSAVGGELYANELESIAEAIPAARPPEG